MKQTKKQNKTKTKEENDKENRHEQLKQNKTKQIKQTNKQKSKQYVHLTSPSFAKKGMLELTLGRYQKWRMYCLFGVFSDFAKAIQV